MSKSKSSNRSQSKAFDDINVSTTTIVATTNLILDINMLFQKLPVESLSVPVKIKTKNDIKQYILDLQLPVGTIISVEHCNDIRGFKIQRRKNATSAKKLKNKKVGVSEQKDVLGYVLPSVQILSEFDNDITKIPNDHEFIFAGDNTAHTFAEIDAYAKNYYENINSSEPVKQKKYFRNTLTVVMMTNDKLINFKVPKQGKVQMTGCTKNEHARICIQYLWKYIQQIHAQHPSVYVFKSGNHLETIFRTVMTDIIFHLGFEINRQSLDEFINRQTVYNSLLETSFGYTGVNIKIPFEHENTMLETMSFENGKWIDSQIAYNDYVKTLDSKELSKEKNKKRNNTFLVFFSGTAIMSGMTQYYMRGVYEKFMSMIQDARSDIEEKPIQESDEKMTELLSEYLNIDTSSKK